VEAFPSTLGALNDQFERRGAPLAKPLFERIRGLCQDGRFQKPGSPQTMLALSVPLLREIGAVSEQTVEIGFLVGQNIADLGVAMGALVKVDAAGLNDAQAARGGDGSTYLAVNLIGAGDVARTEWRDVVVGPLMVTSAFAPEEGRQMAGLADGGPVGTLAGFGALGSQMFDLWARSGWGRWSIIDPDYIKPHNLARHTALARHIGVDKAHVGTDMAGLVFSTQPAITRGIADRADNVESAAIRDALDASEIVVDVTTDLGVPRVIAARDSVKRAVSAFITPSGLGAVMLVEDAQRSIRLDALEAQYYRHILSEPWGAQHLAGHLGHVWTGAGCRDLSAVIPNELIALHAANLARMTRMRSATVEGSILVWHYDSGSGSLCSNSYVPAASQATSLSGLKVVWDAALRAKVRAERESHLPNETGGVLLGYFDLVMGTATIVDALSAPSDSREERTGFVRGIEGLEEAVVEAGRRTANVVRYVGEWHSHPRDHSAQPSGDDVVLLVHLASALRSEGLPALMLIVGESDEHWVAGEAL